MRLPPYWVRRLLIAPGLVVGVALAVVSLPVVVVAAAFISRYVPGKWRILRIIWFLFLYLLVEAASLVAMFALWVASGFGWKVTAPRLQRAHYRLLGWMLRRVVASAKFTFKISIVRKGPRPRTVGERRARPVVVLSRHAGPGDSMLLMDALSNTFDRRPRIVLKEHLQWDPAVDVILNRIPSVFVRAGQAGRDGAVAAIEELAAGMDVDDAFVIFPEGANYTEKRYQRAIAKLREIGRPDLAERGEELENMLPPRSKGVMAALASAPPKTDVFFVGHAGLETFVTAGDVWRGMPMDTDVAVKIWPFPAERVPPPERQETWLYDTWAEIDSWIGERLAETAEPFDEIEAY